MLIFALKMDKRKGKRCLPFNMSRLPLNRRVFRRAY